MAPFWVRKSKQKGLARQHSDHNAICVQLEMISNTTDQAKLTNNDLPTGWKISEEGMEKFNQITQTIDDSKLEGREELELKNLIDQLMDACFRRKKKGKMNHSNVNEEKTVFMPDY